MTTRNQFLQAIRVLIMDDDLFIREITRKMLNRLGYDVECVENGNEAIEMFQSAQETQQPFEAVILDLNIPNGMGGEETISYLKQIDPKVNVIVASGESNHPVMADFRRYGFRVALSKPFDLDDLSHALRAARAAHACV
ncbi:MAG: response regulator [bacterium]